MEYTIVPMDRSHVGQIAELERECFSAPWSEAMLTEALFDAQASFIVAESEDGGLLGYAGLHVVLDEGYIDNIAVDPNARRHGVAEPESRIQPVPDPFARHHAGRTCRFVGRPRRPDRRPGSRGRTGRKAGRVPREPTFAAAV